MKRFSYWLITQTVIQTCYEMQLHWKTRCKKQAYSPLNEVMIIIGFTNISQ